MRRWIAVAVVVTLLVPVAAADSFGSFTPVSDRSIDDTDASFRIGLVNTGNRTRTVQLAAVTGENLSVTFDRDTISLEPSSVSEQPRDGGWLYTGDVYVEPVYVDLNATINRSTVHRNHTFHVDVTASIPGSSGAIGASVVQQRRHTFSVSSRSPVLDPPDRGQGGVFDIIGDGPDDPATDRSPGGRDDGTGRSGVQDQQKNITGDTAASTGDGGIDAVTVVLVAAITVTTASILWELV